MIEKIKELRVRIDGLAQLVKGLKPKSFIVDVAKLPTGKKADEFIKEFLASANNYHATLVDSVEGTNPIVQVLESHEINKTYDSLILAKAWLGKVLGELGNPTPYQNDGKRKDVKDIEPTADTATKHPEFITQKMGEIQVSSVKGSDWLLKTHIEKVDWLRQEIQKVIDNKLSLEDYTPEEEELKREPARNEYFYEIMYQQYLTEARFWLGFELGRLRDKANK